MDLIRTKAAIFVILLIGAIALVIILIANSVAPLLVHGSMAQDPNDGTMHTVEHNAGTILSIAPDQKSFVLKDTTGQQITYTCTNRCLTQLGHMQRHISEKAKTDIYFIQTTANVLDAVDVD